MRWYPDEALPEHTSTRTSPFQHTSAPSAPSAQHVYFVVAALCCAGVQQRLIASAWIVRSSSASAVLTCSHARLQQAPRLGELLQVGGGAAPSCASPTAPCPQTGLTRLPPRMPTHTCGHSVSAAHLLRKQLQDAGRCNALPRARAHPPLVSSTVWGTRAVFSSVVSCQALHGASGGWRSHARTTSVASSLAFSLSSIVAAVAIMSPAAAMRCTSSTRAQLHLKRSGVPIGLQAGVQAALRNQSVLWQAQAMQQACSA